MAKILFGGGIADMRGSIGGTTYARNKAGAYARNRTKPINPGTVLQSDNRLRFGDQSAGWSILTQAQRDSWNAYAAGLTRLNGLGQSYVPSGRQIYLETALNLTLAEATVLSVPSAFTTNPSITGKGAIAAAQTAGALTTLTLGNVDVVIPSSGDGDLIIDATPPVNGEKQNVTNLFRNIPGTWATSGSKNLLATYTGIFGTAAVAGQFIWMRYRVVDHLSGLASANALDNLAVT